VTARSRRKGCVGGAGTVVRISSSSTHSTHGFGAPLHSRGKQFVKPSKSAMSAGHRGSHL
jgi:hypothetical protein